MSWFGSPHAAPDTAIRVQVVYLGGDPRKATQSGKLRQSEER